MTNHEQDRYDHVCNMVRKMYPAFDPAKQYAFWLVLDLYVPYVTEKLEAVVKFFDETNQEIPFSDISNGKQVIRRPYLNKSLFQIGGRYRNRRTTGLFFVADNFDDLARIHKVQVEWLAVIPVSGIQSVFVRQSEFLLTWEFREAPCWYVCDHRDWLDGMGDCPQYLWENHAISLRREMKRMHSDFATVRDYQSNTQPEQVCDTEMLSSKIADMQVTHVSDMSAADRIMLDYGCSVVSLAAEDAVALVQANKHKKHRAFLYF